MDDEKAGAHEFTVCRGAGSAAYSHVSHVSHVSCGRRSGAQGAGGREPPSGQTIVALTSAIRPSSPLTKLGDSSVDSSVASATASEMATASGISSL